MPLLKSHRNVFQMPDKTSVYASPRPQRARGGQGVRAVLSGVFTALILAMGSLTRAGASMPVGEQNQSLAQNGNTAPAVSTLHVTGKAGRFTVLADSADVRSALKLVFDQAEKQFVLDSSVTGQVTLRLTDQPFRTVLTALCEQAFLKWEYDAENGIFHFSRDEEAVKAAFTRLRTLNTLLRQQLRLMGLDIPGDTQLGLPLSQYSTKIVPQIQTRNGFAGGLGGFGGGRNTPAERPMAELRQQQTRASASPEKEETASPDAQRRAKLDQSDLARRGVQSPLGTATPANGALDSMALKEANVYQRFLTQNNLVAYRTPKGQPAPMTDVLTELGRQANIPILIDPDVPTGPKFRLEGTISARPLPDALNILSLIGHLEWRWVGDKVFVTTSPDFSVFYGDSDLPRASTRSQLSAGRKAKAAPSKPVPGEKRPDK